MVRRERRERSRAAARSRDAGGADRRRTRAASPSRTPRRSGRCRSAGPRTARRGSSPRSGSPGARAAGVAPRGPRPRTEHGDRRGDQRPRRRAGRCRTARAGSARARREPPAAQLSAARARRARAMPPSPLLSARSTKMRYLIETTIRSDHRTSETTPSTAAGSAPSARWRFAASSAALRGSAPAGFLKHSFIAYSGGRPDVAVDDAEGAEGEPRDGPLVLVALAGAMAGMRMRGLSRPAPVLVGSGLRWVSHRAGRLGRPGPEFITARSSRSMAGAFPTVGRLPAGPRGPEACLVASRGLQRPSSSRYMLHSCENAVNLGAWPASRPG